MHTKEPWVYARVEATPTGPLEPYSPWIDGAGPRLVMVDRSKCIHADDMRRIVACVNACADVPTEFLEQISVDKLRRDWLELKQQRDILQAAAENLVRVKGRHHTEQAYKQLEAMNSAVKRLRDGSLVIQHPERKRIADLIESQQQRIKELEAELDRLYRVAHCGSVDSFLACDDEVKRGYFAMMVEESTENKKLRERVAELEAAFEQVNRNRESVDALKNQLAALRRHIDDATVVAHITEDGKVFSNGFVRDTDKPLISKEDLQK